MKLLHLNTEFRHIAVNPLAITCILPSNDGCIIYFMGEDNNAINVTQQYSFVIGLIEDLHAETQN